MSNSNDSMLHLLKLLTDSTVSININGNNILANDIAINQSSDNGIVVMADGIPYKSVDGLKINITVNGDIGTLIIGSGSVNCKNINSSFSTMSADVTADDISGNVSTASGDINCDNINGNVSTVSGDVSCDNLSGSAKTISGDIIKGK